MNILPTVPDIAPNQVLFGLKTGLNFFLPYFLPKKKAKVSHVHIEINIIYVIFSPISKFRIRIKLPIQTPIKTTPKMEFDNVFSGFLVTQIVVINEPINKWITITIATKDVDLKLYSVKNKPHMLTKFKFLMCLYCVSVKLFHSTVDKIMIINTRIEKTGIVIIESSPKKIQVKRKGIPIKLTIVLELFDLFFIYFK